MRLPSVAPLLWLGAPLLSQPAWPSPRSWEMASKLYAIGLDIAPVVGAAAAAEFTAFLELYQTLSDLDAILRGEGDGTIFPVNPSARYATTIGLTVRAASAEQAYNAFSWLAQTAPPEWVQLYATDLFRRMRARGQMSALTEYVMRDQTLQSFLKDYQRLMSA